MTISQWKLFWIQPKSKGFIINTLTKIFSIKNILPTKNKRRILNTPLSTYVKDFRYLISLICVALLPIL